MFLFQKLPAVLPKIGWQKPQTLKQTFSALKGLLNAGTLPLLVGTVERFLWG